MKSEIVECETVGYFNVKIDSFSNELTIDYEKAQSKIDKLLNKYLSESWELHSITQINGSNYGGSGAFIVNAAHSCSVSPTMAFLLIFKKE